MKRTWVGIAVLAGLAAGFCLGCGPESRARRDLERDLTSGAASFEEKLLLAKVQLEGGEAARALSLLDALQAGPGAQENRRQILRGLALEKLVRLGAAYQAYDAARLALPNDGAALVREGALAHVTGDNVKCLLLMNRGLKLTAGMPEAYYYIYLLDLKDAARSEALSKLLVYDGPQGEWTTRALLARKRTP